MSRKTRVEEFEDSLARQVDAQRMRLEHRESVVGDVIERVLVAGAERRAAAISAERFVRELRDALDTARRHCPIRIGEQS